jgi:hypothetical protein
MVPTNIVTLIVSVKKKKYKNPNRKRQLFKLSIIGIIIGFLLQIPLCGGLLLLAKNKNSDDNKEYIETGTLIYWEPRKGGWDKTFIYNDRTYKKFRDYFGMEKDEPIANINQRPTEKKETLWNRLLNPLLVGFLLLGEEEVIYTVKNCDDLSLLAVGTLVYCDAELEGEKLAYYNNWEKNYDPFISRTYEDADHPLEYETVRPISESDYNMLIKIAFIENDETIALSKKNHHEYIHIFRASHDKVKGVWKTTFLVDNDIIYKFKRLDAHGYRATPLSDEQIAIIFSLLE